MKTFEPSFTSAAWAWWSPVILHLARVLGIVAGCSAGCMVAAAIAPLVISACLIVPPLLCGQYAAHRHRERRAEALNAGRFIRYPDNPLVFRSWSQRRN